MAAMAALGPVIPMIAFRYLEWLQSSPMAHPLSIWSRKNIKSSAFSIHQKFYLEVISDVPHQVQVTRPPLSSPSTPAMRALRLLCLWTLWLLTRGQTPNTTGKICQWGCWDEEDEACHPGLNEARKQNWPGKK